MTGASLNSAFALGAAAEAGFDSGLLHALAERPGTPVDLASRVQLDATSVGAVLEVLASWALVVRRGDQFAASETLLRDLRGPSGRMGTLSQLFGHVPEWLRTGHSLVERPDRAAAYARVTPSLGALFESAAMELAQRLPGEPARILDVGAGSAVWSVAMLAEHPNSNAVALDLEPVLPRAVEHADARGVSERLTTMPADFHDVQLETGGFDRIVIANVLHLESEHDALGVLRRLRPALRPGGQIVVVDALSDGSAVQERERAAYALHLALRIPGGHPHRREVIEGWMSEVGLREATTVNLTEGPAGLGAVVAVG